MIGLIHSYEVKLTESHGTSETYALRLNWLFVSLWISNSNNPSSLWETGIVQRPLFICSVEKTNETWSLHVCTISLTVRLFLCNCLDLSAYWKALVFAPPHTHTSSYIVDYSRNLSTVSNRFYVLFYDAVTVWHNAVICKHWALTYPALPDRDRQPRCADIRERFLSVWLRLVTKLVTINARHFQHL